MSALWIVGDVHGAHDKLRALLMQAGLTDRNGYWTGGDAHLVFLGDYFDRGPDGIGVVRLIQKLEEEAPRSGGQVSALIGNHEVMFLAASRFRRVDPTDRLGFYGYWAGNGGRSSDMQRLEGADITWLSQRPALMRVGHWLLTHADSLFYLHLGRSMADINARVRELLTSTDAGDWGSFANTFVDRLNFAGADGEQAALKMLRALGGECIVHGHTPIQLLVAENEQGIDAEPVAPIRYAAGRCLAVDSGMAYFGDAGFITRLGESEVEQVATLPAGLFATPEPVGLERD